MGTDTLSFSLKREALELRSDLILLLYVGKCTARSTFKIIALISPYGKGLWVQIHHHSLKGEEHFELRWAWSFYGMYVGSPTTWTTIIFRQLIARSYAKPHCMHLFASGVSVWIPGSWLEKMKCLFSLLTFIVIWNSAKKGATVNISFYTYQYLESLVPMTILSCLSKSTLSSEPERRFGASLNSNQGPKAQTGPSKHMHPSKRCTHYWHRWKNDYLT